MCGICGFVGRGDEGVLAAMVDALAHRGPDDRGVYFDPEARIGLGHTRLSIIDPSPSGHQPMATADGDVWITYNGELYNHLELRRVLEDKYRFQSRCDTETLLWAYVEWGPACLERCNGMFALAVWDARVGRLWLARDRLGIKPLYYWTQGENFRFASEVKALAAAPDFRPELDAQAADCFLRLRYVRQPRTLLSGVQALEPGRTLTWERGRSKVQSYWCLDWGRRDVTDRDEAAERFEGLLSDSVRLRLMSDVPLGTFLSGGLDSTTITALAAGHASGPVQTFSVGFEGAPGELPFAEEAARLLGAGHDPLLCRVDDFLQLPEVVAAMDLPVGDAVIVPMYLLSRRARESVKTVLTGEGADELLMGYAHQNQLVSLARISGWLRLPGLTGLIALSARLLPPRFWERFFAYGASLGRAGVERMILLLKEARSRVRSYLNFASLFTDEERRRLYAGPLAALAGREAPAGFNPDVLADPTAPHYRSLLRHEMEGWLPDNILMKQDGLTMANSIEGRVPFLDHRLVEEVVRWSPRVFAALAGQKRILRSMLERRHPDLPRRAKEAFRFDIDDQYRPTMLELASEYLFTNSRVTKGLIEPGPIDWWVDELDASPFLRSKQLVGLLVFELWCRDRL
ncbi:MAG: asparagine synthase (glutamine-hydrolyzing) [Proteobacteria bacterium]|nr:asparagine synthase (glutamine-hydrolyzing) [Pseudomonadota bacterium]MBU1740933.1 asparagine synthase (glutamine-hydrolyzing) [Pseudomonadota bacterium]